MARKPRKKSSGKGLLTKKGEAKYFKGTRNPWENKTRGSLREKSEREQVQLSNRRGDLINQQIEAQKASNPYDDIYIPTQDDVAQVQQGPTVNNDVYGRSGFDDVVSQQFANSMSNIQRQQDRQTKDFEQMAAERGWTPGSEVYKEQKSLLNQSQAQQQNNLLSQAQQLGMQGWQTAQSGESQRINSNLGVNDQQFNQQRGRFADLSTQGQQQLGYNTGRRNLAASDAAVMQGMADPNFANYLNQPFQYQLGKMGADTSKAVASTNAAGQVNAATGSAGIYAGAQRDTTAMNNDAALARLQYEQRTGMRYGG